MKTIKVGVIGVGSLGQHHARVFAELAGARLVGVADVDRARAAAIAGRHGGRAVTDYHELLADVDAVSVVTQTMNDAFRIALAQLPFNVPGLGYGRSVRGAIARIKIILEEIIARHQRDVIVTGDEVSNSKPAPDIFIKAAEKLQLSFNECLVIEDAPAGIAAAHAGGMKVIALTSTYPSAELQQADAVVQSLSQLQVSTDGTGPGSLLKISIHQN